MTHGIHSHDREWWTELSSDLLYKRFSVQNLNILRADSQYSLIVCLVQINFSGRISWKNINFINFIFCSLRNSPGPDVSIRGPQSYLQLGNTRTPLQTESNRQSPSVGYIWPNTNTSQLLLIPRPTRTRMNKKSGFNQQKWAHSSTIRLSTRAEGKDKNDNNKSTINNANSD